MDISPFLGDEIGVYQKGEILKSSQYKKEFFPQHKIEDLALSTASSTLSDSLILPSDNIASTMAKEGKWFVPGVTSAVSPPQGQSSSSSLSFEQKCMKCESFAFREVTPLSKIFFFKLSSHYIFFYKILSLFFNRVLFLKERKLLLREKGMSIWCSKNSMNNRESWKWKKVRSQRKWRDSKRLWRPRVHSHKEENEKTSFLFWR